MLLDADFNVQVERPRPIRGVVHGGRPARPISRRRDAAERPAFHQPLRPARRSARDHGVAVASLFCARPPAHVGAAAFGMLVGVALEPSRSQGRLEAEIVWQDRLMSNVGRLAVNGDGGMILASCYTLGIQRFDLHGRNEGSYHLGGTVSHAVPDFPGRTIAAATLEGELAVMNSAGNVRWRTRLPRPVIALEIDPLGRYLIYGHATGEIVRLDLFGGSPGRSPSTVASARTDASPRHGAGRADRHRARCGHPTGWFPWSKPTSSPRPRSSPSRMTRRGSLLFTSPHRLQLFNTAGQKQGPRPDMTGVGRILRTAPGWLAAATDRQIVLCDLSAGSPQRDRRQPGPAHPPGDQSGRLRAGADPGARSDRQADARQPLDLEARAARRRSRTWRSARTDIAAITTNGGQFLVFDPAGESDGRLHVRPERSAAPDRSARGIARRRCLDQPGAPSRSGCADMASTARSSGSVPSPGKAGRCLGSAGVVAASPRPTAAPSLATAPGRFAHREPPAAIPTTSSASIADGEPVRISRHGVHLICASLDGRVSGGASSTNPSARSPRYARHRRPARQIARLVQQRAERLRPRDFSQPRLVACS